MVARTFLSQTKREAEFYQYILLMELAEELTIMVCKFSRMNGTVLRFPRGREHCAMKYGKDSTPNRYHNKVK